MGAHSSKDNSFIIRYIHIIYSKKRLQGHWNMSSRCRCTEPEKNTTEKKQNDGRIGNSAVEWAVHAALKRPMGRMPCIFSVCFRTFITSKQQEWIAKRCQSEDMWAFLLYVTKNIYIRYVYHVFEFIYLFRDNERIYIKMAQTIRRIERQSKNEKNAYSRLRAQWHYCWGSPHTSDVRSNTTNTSIMAICCVARCIGKNESIHLKSMAAFFVQNAIAQFNHY